MVTLVFDVPERITPPGEQAIYQPKGVAERANGYWQAIPLMRRTVQLAGKDVIAWLVYTTEPLENHPGDCGDPRPLRRANGSWEPAPATVRIQAFIGAHPMATEILEEAFPERDLGQGVLRRILLRTWSGMSTHTQEDSGEL